jgi:predicted ATPase
MIVRDLRVQNFRSLNELEVLNIGSFFALTGRNGSGKSNVLRALSALFSGEVEPGKALDLVRDHYGTPERKRKKRVRVEGHFVLPDEFNFHTSVRSTAQQLGLTSGDFWIRRSWEYGPTWLVEQTFEISHAHGPFVVVAPEQRGAVELLLSRLVRFRYLPNHVHPLAMVRSEAKRLQQVLLTKIRRSKTLKKKVDPEAQLQAMASVADDLIAPVITEIREAADLASVKIEPPTDWTQVALALGVSLQAKGDERRDAEVHGSGHQSLLSLALLHLLDSQFSAAFGWHQANVWALEEPESFLHHELCYRSALLLQRYAQSPRFQILVTTHSPIVMALVESGATLTSLKPTTLKGSQLIEASMHAGAAPFVHPLLIGEAKPLLLVEGITDVKHINAAYRALGRSNPWEVRRVEEYGVAPGTSGFDQLLKHHAPVLAARRASSPVVLVYDHGEKATKVSAVNAQIGTIHARSLAIQWDPAGVNPDLDLDCFTGVEAYLSTKALEDCSSTSNLQLLTPQGQVKPISIKKSQTTEMKSKLAAFCEAKQKQEHYGLFIPFLDAAEIAAGLRKQLLI